MALTGDSFDFVQGGVVTSSAQLVDAGATVGDVLTVQSDKSIAAAPGGGSQPPTPFVQDADPGAVGEGALWVDTSTDPPSLKIRNTADDDWDAAGGGIPQGGPLTEDLLSGGNSVAGTPRPGQDPAFVRIGNQPGASGGGSVELAGGAAGSGEDSGGGATVRGGNGDDGGSSGASIFADGGKPLGVNGKVYVTTDGSMGTAGQVLTSDGAGGVVWADLP